MHTRNHVYLGMKNKMPETILKHTIKTALTLVAFAVAFTALMAAVYQVTKAPIAAGEAAAREALFQQVIAQDQYNNPVLEDTITIKANALLGNKQASVANIARMDGLPVAVILEATAHDGYSGKIKLLVAIQKDSTISGVRVIAHTETPGLGDYIDIAKNNWIKLFDQESLKKTSGAHWKVTKDGGTFDYMAGATITPRAVVKAVYKALQYFEQNKATLLAPASANKEEAA